jgi:hypothetical protein
VDVKDRRADEAGVIAREALESPDPLAVDAPKWRKSEIMDIFLARF